MAKPTLITDHSPTPTDKIQRRIASAAEAAIMVLEALDLSREEAADAMAMGIVAMLYRSDRAHIRRFVRQLQVNLEHYTKETEGKR